ncbi:MAG TPA: hypothetical protein VM165_22765 [Planctomycetaceae bacterium]|nr:hypothetical protein [Planctomycetaceae bacterium]
MIVHRRDCLRWLGAGLVLFAGCSPSEIRPQGSGDEAKAALLKVLEAWKAGGAPDELPKASPKIIIVDHDWAGGRRLADYAIVEDPVLNGSHWRVFANLTLLRKSQLDKPQRVCYAVTLGPTVSILRSDFLD